MDCHLTFKEHHNQGMKNARAVEARLRSLKAIHGVVPACARAVEVACVQAIALYGRPLWWDRTEASQRDNLQLLLNCQASSTRGARLTTPRRMPVSDSGLTPVALTFDTRQQRFESRLASTCKVSKVKELYDYPTPGAPVVRVATIEHARGRGAEMMCWLDPGAKPAVKTTLLEDDGAAKKAAEL